jgi:hypothetical protein
MARCIVLPPSQRLPTSLVWPRIRWFDGTVAHLNTSSRELCRATGPYHVSCTTVRRQHSLNRTVLFPQRGRHTSKRCAPWALGLALATTLPVWVLPAMPPSGSHAKLDYHNKPGVVDDLNSPANQGLLYAFNFPFYELLTCFVPMIFLPTRPGRPFLRTVWHSSAFTNPLAFYRSSLCMAAPTKAFSPCQVRRIVSGTVSRLDLHALIRATKGRGAMQRERRPGHQ